MTFNECPIFKLKLFIIKTPQISCFADQKMREILGILMLEKLLVNTYAHAFDLKTAIK